jgi:hypothetical protein
MAIHRHAPGERAPLAGRYRLVGHYGEMTPVAVWCEVGDRLPTFPDDEPQFGPYWFVLEHEADQKTRAA